MQARAVGCSRSSATGSSISSALPRSNSSTREGRRRLSGSASKLRSSPPMVVRRAAVSCLTPEHCRANRHNRYALASIIDATEKLADCAIEPLMSVKAIVITKPKSVSRAARLSSRSSATGRAMGTSAATIASVGRACHRHHSHRRRLQSRPRPRLAEHWADFDPVHARTSRPMFSAPQARLLSDDNPPGRKCGRTDWHSRRLASRMKIFIPATLTDRSLAAPERRRAKTRHRKTD